MKDVYTISELALYWRVSEWTIRKLIKTGLLKVFKVGSVYRISKDEVNRYMSDNSDNTNMV